jgi:hypothetical protein
MLDLPWVDYLENGDVNMLHYLLEQLQLVVPALSICQMDENIYIQYPDNYELSEIETNNVANILNQWPLMLAKIDKKNILKENWKKRISQGWQSSNNITLGLTESDISLLMGAFLLAKESISLTPDKQVYFVDFDGISRNMSLDDFTTLMLHYGQARSILSATYANKIDNINSALTIEDLNNIDLTI